jgi:hypothetical protein
MNVASDSLTQQRKFTNIRIDFEFEQVPLSASDNPIQGPVQQVPAPRITVERN